VLTLRGQFFMTTVATCLARRDAFYTATTAAADKKQQQERMCLRQLIATTPHNRLGQDIKKAREGAPAGIIVSHATMNDGNGHLPLRPSLLTLSLTPRQ